jgi:glycosyltransferase involved in cell wall biosynthesis
LTKLTSIWFWQRFVSPHKSHLAEAIGSLGQEVTYVANDFMSIERKKMGWSASKLKKTKILIKKTPNALEKLIISLPSNSIHFCQGIRANGLVSYAQKFLTKRKIKQWLFMEIVEDKGLEGLIKRMVYNFLLNFKQKNINGILAIGSNAETWYFKRGFDKEKIFPFAYFLSDNLSKIKKSRKHRSTFRFIYVGQLIKRKRVDFLLSTLSLLRKSIDFELEIIGDGPLHNILIKQANKLLPGKVKWLGSLQMKDIPKKIANADCLVLPSRHDGWGSVISESLMVGTPVICSNTCGASTVVKESKIGGVFQAESISQFKLLLYKVLNNGPISNLKRNRLRKWAKCLGAKEGAKYLIKILQFHINQVNRPKPPWIN